jgi:hypothetical protein
MEDLRVKSPVASTPLRKSAARITRLIASDSRSFLMSTSAVS